MPGNDREAPDATVPPVSRGRPPTPPPPAPATAKKQKPAYPHSSAIGGRYAASRRLPPIAPCGCRRDPLTDRHRCDGEISDHMAEAAAVALLHLDGLGTPGLLDDRTCRAIWRIGHPRLAAAVHARTSGGGDA